MKRIAIIILCLSTIQLVKAQERVITTGVPFLLVAADARAAGLADQGVATSADAFSQQWNPAKYAFSLEKQGFSMSYTPYLTALVNDISLGQLTYFNRINERSAFAGSIRYFSLGEIELRQNIDDVANIVKPNEFSLDGSYALKLSDKFSMSVAGRFIDLLITQGLEALTGPFGQSAEGLQDGRTGENLLYLVPRGGRGGDQCWCVRTRTGVGDAEWSRGD